MAGKRIEVAPEDRVVLEQIVRSRRVERRAFQRAQIVLLAAEGLAAAEIARRVGCSDKLVKRWRGRYERDGLDGLREAPRSGRPLTYGPETRALLIAKACTRPPDTESGQRRERWTHRELGEQVGMSESQAHVILSAADIKPHRTESWVMTDFDEPEFEARAGESVAWTWTRSPGRWCYRLTRRPRSRPRAWPGPTRRLRQASPPGATTSTPATAR
jgi:transposase